MIRFGSLKGIKDISAYDEIWLCVNSSKDAPSELLENQRVFHVKELAPNDMLFAWYKMCKKENIWTEEKFQKIYVPNFLDFISKNDESKRCLKYLLEQRFTKNIYIACFCADENEKTCHRSILNEILYTMADGQQVEQPAEFRNYKLRDPC